MGLLPCLLFASLYVNAQKASKDTVGTPLSTVITIQPLYFVTSAVKLDIEFRKPDSKRAIGITPEFFNGNIKDADLLREMKGLKQDKLSGFGIGIFQKYYVANGPYFAYGLTYRYQTIVFDSQGFAPYQKDGYTFYEYGSISDKWKINSFLANTVIGYQAVKYDFVYDIYLGFGYKHPSIKADHPEARKYDRGVFNYAYDGLVYLMGFKVGYKIK